LATLYSQIFILVYIFCFVFVSLKSIFCFHFVELSPFSSDEFFYIIRKLDPKEKKTSAVFLINQLIAIFPAFGDQRECLGEMRYFFKRAQLVAGTLYRRFKASWSFLVRITHYDVP
jgi:hypothetical protein